VNAPSQRPGSEPWQFLPESHDRPELDRAIAAVPMVVLTRETLLWGTPEQAVRRLRGFGDAGLSHVVLAPVAGLVSQNQPTADAMESPLCGNTHGGVSERPGETATPASVAVARPTLHAVVDAGVRS
jgi:hypothetical protein